MTIQPLDDKGVAEIKAGLYMFPHEWSERILSLLARLDKAEAGWQDERPILAEYTNWRGERAIRTFIPRRVFWGSNEWHPEPQVLIEAYDCEKEALRTFAAAGFAPPPPSAGA